MTVLLIVTEINVTEEKPHCTGSVRVLSAKLQPAQAPTCEHVNSFEWKTP